MNNANPAARGRTAVVVLGMHRSGTSATSGMLSKLGCDLPKHEMQPNHANEPGYFESRALQILHDELLASAGSAWDDWTEISESWFKSPTAGMFRDRAVQCLHDEFGNSPLFVFKDPRTCRFFSFWREIFDAQACRIALVHIHRNPLEVAKSLEKRDGIPQDLGLLLWLRHVLDGEAQSRGLPRAFTSYDQLLSDWRQVAGTVQALLDLALPRTSRRAEREIDDFLITDHVHFRIPAEQVSKSSRVSEWISKTFDIMERWVAEGERRADHEALDKIRASFNAALPAFESLLVEARKLPKLLAELDGLRHENDALARRLPSPEDMDALQKAQHRIEELCSALSQTQSALEQRNHEAEETAKALKRTETDLQSLRAELDGQKAYLADEAARRRDAETHTAQLRKNLSQTLLLANSEKASLVSTMARYQAEAEKVKGTAAAERARLSGQLQETVAKLSTQETEIGRLQTELEYQNNRAEAAEFLAAALRESRTWRMTGPLRALVSLFRG